MPIDYNYFYDVLESKVQEGITRLEKMSVDDRDYQETLSNLVTTANLVKTFGDIVPAQNGGTPEGIKVGDSYSSLDGSSDDSKIVIFTSEHCSFCNAMKPVYLPVLDEMNIHVEHVNTGEDEGGQFSQKLGINGIPAYLLVKNGIVQYRWEGFDTAKSNQENIDLLKGLIKTYL